MSDVTLRRATAADLDYVESLLSANGLPTDDVRDGAAAFYVAADGERIGVGGLERPGEAALLRSVVVEEAMRGQGYGASVTRRLCSRAASDATTEIYALTTTAAAFFEALGFERVAREDVPAAVRGTRQFDELCPASAVCLRRRLDR